MHYIDMPPKEAAISLLQSIAYHDRQARKAEARDREKSLRYHEASRRMRKSCLLYMKSVGRKKLVLADWNMKRRKQQKLETTRDRALRG